jgi:L-fuconolactonase
MSLRIDAHQHFWHLHHGYGDWPPSELTRIYRDFTPADLAELCRESHIDGTIAVQSNPHLGDTEYLLGLANEHASILGVVGWVDLMAADAASQIAAMARHPRLKGVRVMLQDLPAHNWIESDQIQPAIQALIAHDLSLDALVLPQHLVGLYRFAERNQGLRVVIDHAGKPDIANRVDTPWREDLHRLATLSVVHCKLSGLLTEAAPNDGREALQPYMDAILEAFGVERVIWGSDWPVVNLASSYQQWVRISTEYLREHKDQAVREGEASIMGLNARRFYRIDQPVRR